MVEKKSLAKNKNKTLTGSLIIKITKNAIMYKCLKLSKSKN